MIATRKNVDDRKDWKTLLCSRLPTTTPTICCSVATAAGCLLYTRGVAFSEYKHTLTSHPGDKFHV